MRRIDQGLDYLMQLYPTSIGEACFIDRGGPENARVVRGTWATPKELSPDESKNPFFKPTFALNMGEVYQARPYVSPDTHEWVISNSTPLPMPGGRTRAIVHFELTIESFRRAAAKDAGKFEVAIVEGATGAVVLDTQNPQRTGAKLGRPDDRRFSPLLARSAPGGVLDLGKQRVAYRHLARTRGNANDWYVVAAAPQVGAASVLGINSAPLGMLVIALLAIAFLMGRRWVKTSTEALTDALTGLGNRRKLITDLERRLPTAHENSPVLLLLFDLDGFKLYNDAFGHPAGDALLVRLGHNLARAVAPQGEAYRLGGDEFCVLAPIDGDSWTPMADAATAALSERGEGFAIGSSYGSLVLVGEEQDSDIALREVDKRLYANKHGGRRSAGWQSTDVLMQVLRERNADLGAHVSDVAELAGRVGAKLGLEAEELDYVRQAAELHDIGKMAIPDAILNKPGSLDSEEWEFVRQHSVTGERILSAAPSLVQVAKLVRWSHERIDGTGYPDGLTGDKIPIGSRIVAVCDAFDAMTGPRPYRSGMSEEDAIAELRRCAGTQFDPEVVDVFCSVIADRHTAPDRSLVHA